VNHSIIIREPRHRDEAIRRLNAINYGPDNPVEVVIRSYKKNRSLEQNNLYWDWLSLIGKTLGYTKDEMHETLMRRFLKPVVTEGPDGPMETYSTKRLKVEEMSEYLNHIDRQAAELGIRLPHPDDRRAA